MIERRMMTEPVVEERTDTNPTINGTASVFYDADDAGTEFELWKDGPKERIMPEAFDRALEEKDDVVALFNHNVDNVLGRTPNTLRLNVTHKGLNYEIKPDTTSVGRDVLKMVRRGDVRGSSFSFTVEHEEWKKEGDQEIREIHSVKLHDISPVTRPAYEASTSGVRSVDCGEARESYDRWKRKLETQKRFKNFEDRG